jgi:hypothetical protein
MSIGLEKPAMPISRLEHGPHEQHAVEDHGDREVIASFESPFDLPTWRKWVITTLLALMTTAVTFASSVWSAAIAKTSEEFNVSETVSLLGVSLYVLGFAVGPIIWGTFTALRHLRIPYLYVSESSNCVLTWRCGR